MTRAIEREQDVYSMVHRSQLGEGEGYAVFHVASITRMSDHETKDQARGAILRYLAADKRRAVDTAQ